MEDISNRQGKKKDEKKEKAYVFLDHQEGKNNENCKKNKKHNQQMGKPFVLQEPNLGEVICSKSFIERFFFQGGP